jgi:hypothetical protein
LIQLKADVLRPVHISIERCITLRTHVQAAFNALTVVFPTTDATRFARVALRHFYGVDAFDFRLVGEKLRESVERPPVQVKIAVIPPVLRLTGLVLSNASEFPDVDLTNATLDTCLYDVFGEAVEEVGSAL